MRSTISCRLIVEREDYYWKIDYYGGNMEFHSPDPAELSVTIWVLTIMRVDEYGHLRPIGRLIGTLCCELLEHMFLWNAGELKRKLEGFRQCYSANRVHISLNGDIPSETAGEATGRCANLRKSHCCGRYQAPIAT